MGAEIMDPVRGVLFLREAGEAAGFCGELPAGVRVAECVFDASSRRLPQAQTALWQLRRECDWVCVAARGACGCVAAALAAQLPVDRLVLAGNRLFAPVNDNWPRELRRLNAFARRNLSLITAQLVLVAPEGREVRRMLRCACNAQLCIAGGDESCAQLLTAPWAGEDRSAAE